jgi:hypothetical protein
LEGSAIELVERRNQPSSGVDLDDHSGAFGLAHGGSSFTSKSPFPHTRGSAVECEDVRTPWDSLNQFTGGGSLPNRNAERIRPHRDPSLRARDEIADNDADVSFVDPARGEQATETPPVGKRHLLDEAA